ncbi:MAG: radical SAM protein, partial [Treponema sp.]|nr:radical SAM protein [Treponema sp.]
MFPERYRSHHDGERCLDTLLGRSRGKQILGLLRAGGWGAVEAKLREAPGPLRPRGIYIHVPHCDRICSFCNLNRTERKGADLDAYTAYLIGEIEMYGRRPYIRGQPFDAVYFGGGTPTVLSAEQFSLVLKALGDNIPLKADCEITVESTLHNLGAEKAAALERGGVNRFSIGIQTFSGRGREILGRTWDGKKALEQLRALRSAFGGILCLDIIYSYPGESPEEVSYDAECCAALPADSVSFYSLMIYPGSKLGKAIESGAALFDRDIEFDKERHHIFYRGLRDRGFELLELSKLARPGRDRYQYIRVRYDNGDIIPIGAGAGGNIGGIPLYSMAPGRRFVSAPDPRYEKYHKILGYLQFGLYDTGRITGELDGEAKKAVEERVRYYHSQGILEEGAPGAPLSLSADGVFWGNNIAVDILTAAIKAERPAR